METLQVIRIAILTLTLLKKKDTLTPLEIVMTLLPYVDKTIGKAEAEAVAELITLLIEE